MMPRAVYSRDGMRVHLGHDQRDVILVAEPRSVVDDHAAGRSSDWAQTSRETSAPAENRPMSAGGEVEALHIEYRPGLALESDDLAQRAVARQGVQLADREARSSRTLIIVSPTRPVAPRTATLQPLLIP